MCSRALLFKTCGPVGDPVVNDVGACVCQRVCVCVRDLRLLFFMFWVAPWPVSLIAVAHAGTCNVFNNAICDALPRGVCGLPR